MGDYTLAAQLKARGIRDSRVLEAIAGLSRRDFVLPQDAADALGDHPLPIGEGQTISQPYIVAYMSQALHLRGDERVLEIGTGSGYQAAVLSRLCSDVFSIEIRPALASQARARLQALGLTNVHVREGDGHQGWPEAAPFDAIILTAAPRGIPQPLLPQLSVGGRLIAPIGPEDGDQVLVRLTKDARGELDLDTLLAVRFVPMTGGLEASHVGGSPSFDSERQEG